MFNVYFFIFYNLAYNVLAHHSPAALPAALPVLFLNNRFKSPTDDTPIRIQDCV